MNVLKCFLLVSCCAIAQIPKGTASIEGRVVTSTGAPMQGARIQLLSGILSDYQMSVATIETDAEGRFSFKGLNPGPAQLEVTRTGYGRHGQGITLGADQHLTDIVVRLTRLGTIAGRITDETGDPVSRVTVGIFSKFYSNGWRWRSEMSARTGEDGAYEIRNITPGRYFLMAVPSSPNPRVEPVGSTLYRPAWYPGVLDQSGATLIEVAVEGEVRDLNIRLQKRNVYRVSGKATTCLGRATSASRGHRFAW
jgi:hypothetical protein